MPSNTQNVEGIIDSTLTNNGNKEKGPFNCNQVKNYLTTNWTATFTAVSESHRPANEKPVIYKPKVTASAWGTKDGGNKASPWGVKKGAKTANGLDLLTELKRPITPKAPSPQLIPTTPSKKTLTTTTKKNH